MNQSQYNQLFAFIWNIANDVLVQAFNKGDYKKVILPMMVLRRLDLLLEPTHEEVLKQKKRLDEIGLPDDAQEQVLFNITKYPFFNTSRFTMKSLRGETNPIRLKSDFEEYLDGFSRDVQDIIEKFRLKQQVENLNQTNRLGAIIEKFTDDSINLGINPVLDKYGNEKLPGVDNHTMGTLFEELLRRFNEENSVTEAGEHFTPRDYVALMADIAVLPIADNLRSATYKIYDGACGTGGILSIAEERILENAQQRGKNVKIDLYGQELQPETFATCKADLMLSSDNVGMFTYKHAGKARDKFYCGSTISDDGHPGMKFDFCISNPPFGTPWKADMEAWGLKENEKDKIADPRFYHPEGYEKVVRFVPSIGDPQMLFLANNLSRMNDDSEIGTRIVEVHNGSSLFTGNAGGGESNLRKYIIEHDLLEAIIAMPEKDFYNTGIGTFIWVVTNRKEERRRGKVQLIDATEIKTPLRKNLGEKNCETNEDDRKAIMKLLMDFEDNERSRIFPNEEFGYIEITVDRPLRLKAQVTNDRIAMCIQDKKFKDFQDWLSRLLEETGGKEYTNFNLFIEDAKAASKKHGYKWKKVNQDALMKYFTEVCPEADIVLDDKGNQIPDKALSDTEQVPLLYEGGVDAFMQNEVLPYTPDAFINEDKTVIGYELSFTKYFYKPIQLRSLETIAADIRSIEENTDGMLNKILGI
jgi:type I restriction enzyme M protein